MINEEELEKRARETNKAIVLELFTNNHSVAMSKNIESLILTAFNEILADSYVENERIRIDFNRIADEADNTIAAFYARVKELEDWILSEAYTAHNEFDQQVCVCCRTPVNEQADWRDTPDASKHKDDCLLNDIIQARKEAENNDQQ